jgi:hypothetical protein
LQSALIEAAWGALSDRTRGEIVRLVGEPAEGPDDDRT